MKFKLVAACAFGLEAIVKRELIALGYDARVSQPGRIQFTGGWLDVCRANLWLRTADRVLVEIQSFDSPDFEALFETVKAFDWSKVIPREASFPVIGRSRLSQLTSVPAVQRSVKKALVESLKRFHGVEELPETGGLYKIEVALLNDVATLTLDTTGPSLHKRGYRKLVADAPLKETLAAALVNLSVWRPERPLVDPFCGSGTIPIEAALAGMNVAPGISREFSSSQWSTISPGIWKAALEEANDLKRSDVELTIQGFDIDPAVLELANYHARLAGVAGKIKFRTRAFAATESELSYGCIVTNPPYGERLDDQDRLIGLYESIPGVMQRLPTWSLFLITNMPRFESLIQKSATRRRKLFNGRLECTYYQFLGPRPPREFDWGSNSAPAGTVLEEKRVVAVDPPEQLPARERVVQVEMAEDVPRSDLARTPEPILVEVINQEEAQLKEAQLTEPQSEESQSGEPQSKEPQSKEPQQEESQQEESQQEESQQEESQQEESRPKENRNEEVQALFGGLEAKDYEQAQLFHNRLVKRARHLRRWPSKRQITCFRLYERDIPEIPLVVDRYEDYLHMAEYERPSDRHLARHTAWLELMRKTAAESLGVLESNTFLKQRHKNRDSHQYEKIDSSAKMVTVSEGGLKFLVNLSDYVDTGLFLDHRVTRGMVRDESRGKSFLNLFAYTGSFSVYAASGGATKTTTVDLSRNYLSWARRNLEGNGFSGPAHRMVGDDSIEFLKSARANRERFDLAVVDPPTYSNSKRTDLDWDVQSRHVELLGLVHSVMSPGGVVYFSTNFRRFKLWEDQIPQFEICEISKRTVPEDFRNRRIHRCWRMVARVIDTT